MEYKILAPVYDKVMSHVNYNDWIQLINRINSKYFIKKKPSILEIGAGTGILGKRLVKQGYSYTGSDYSYYMCREAQKKDLNFICNDCRYIPIKKLFDLVIFLYDGINYLQTIDEYSRLFEQVLMCLENNGLFLFDITTETNSIRYFSDFIDYEDFGDHFYVRHSYYDKRNSTQHNDFTIFKRKEFSDGYFEKHEENHSQKVFPPTVIENIIKKSGFSILGIWDDFTTHKYTLQSERIHFLLKKT